MVCSLMHQVDEIVKNNEYLNIQLDSINSKLNEYDQLNEENLELILEDIQDFIFNYLFKGEVSSLGFKFKTLFDLEDKDLETLKAVHFLLNDKVRTFIYNLPILLRNLSHSTKKENKEFKGIIRGRIDWNDTIKTRYSKGFYDPSLFICTPPSKFYDLEENQLLKYMLKKILELIDKHLKFLYINRAESFKGFNLDTVANENDWYRIIQNNYSMVNKTLKKIYFDRISDVRYIKPKMVRKAKKNRNHLYHLLADIYKLYNDLIENEDEDILKELLNQKIIKAADPHKLYEIYIFYKLVDALPEKPKLGLMHKNNKYAAVLEKEDWKITIHYQHTPNPLSDKDVSEYLRIIDNYTIGGKPRSPDVILEFERDNKRTFRIIEVKNTSDSGYISDSIYKVMGYYKDFERILDIENATYCKNCPIVLVTWDGISIKENKNLFDENIIILNRNEFLNSLKELIELD